MRFRHFPWKLVRGPLANIKVAQKKCTATEQHDRFQTNVVLMQDMNHNTKVLNGVIHKFDIFF
jgi:hypothetical protein